MSCCKKSMQFDCCKQEHLVCTCMGIMFSEICDGIDAGLNTFEKLKDEFMVGTGCSSCVPEITEILEKKLKIEKN